MFDGEDMEVKDEGSKNKDRKKKFEPQSSMKKRSKMSDTENQKKKARRQ